MKAASFLVFAACLALACPAIAAPRPLDTQAVDAILARELARTHAPGAAVAVVQGDKVVFAKGYGLANVETGAVVTPEMEFRIGSTTKMFVAAAAVSLAEQGKLDLDAPASRYVAGLAPAIGRLTPRQLLSHTAGLIDEAPMYGPHDDAALESSVLAWTDAYSFAPPGEVFSYSNPGYRLLGVIIEKVSGAPFADAMDKGVFQPLGMTPTTFRPTTAMTYPLALGHAVDRAGAATIIRPFADDAETWPTGSIFSSAPELARFTIAFMNGGTIDGRQVFPPALIAALQAPRAQTGDAGVAYGFGLEIRQDRGVRIVEHGGGRSGYGSTIIMAPEQKVAVIVVANASDTQMTEAARAIMYQAATFGPPETETLPPFTPNEGDAQRYVGTYVQGALRMNVETRDGRLSIVQGNSALPIRQIGPTLFETAIPGAQVQARFSIVAGKDGKSLYLIRGRRALRRQA
jgi:CubicO group peptidase (beta-lactamase class C family)